ncbi:DivIVA domain-containing protein [Pontibacter sp. 13R65]|uniref:DivIVA domain-containing protein n=1 Tax=Pontibacter sp. 13R65 TaxID=3127458 RepID=UPI00301C4BEF
MKITPLEIRQKTFEKAFRGLDKDEVNAFLLTLSQQWEKLLDENKDLRMKLDAAHRETQKLREVESSLYKTLKTAEDTGNSILEQATKSAELKAREAQLQSDELLNKARNEARSLLEEASQKSGKILVEMQQEVKALEQDYQRLESYLDSMVRDLKNLANDALEKVEKTSAKPKASTLSILSRAVDVKINTPELLQNLKEMKVTNEDLYPVAATPVALQVASEVEPFGDPAPGVNDPIPEIPNPVTPVPSIPGPEIEQPEPDYPGRIPGPEIEQPIPDIQPIKPEEPEIQPPLTEPSRSYSQQPAKQTAGSFFDELG